MYIYNWFFELSTYFVPLINETERIFTEISEIAGVP